MPIKYSDKPQLHYGEQRSEDVWARFPQNARPIATAPSLGGSPVWVFEPSGQAHRALFYQGQWQKLATERDPYNGAVRTRMIGEAVTNPVAWASS